MADDIDTFIDEFGDWMMAFTEFVAPIIARAAAANLISPTEQAEALTLMSGLIAWQARIEATVK